MNDFDDGEWCDGGAFRYGVEGFGLALSSRRFVGAAGLRDSSFGKPRGVRLRLGLRLFRIKPAFRGTARSTRELKESKGVG